MNHTDWKVDMGHRSGYLTFIEKEMAKKLPNCELKVDPHIRSKIKVMKKQMEFILEIQRNASGFSWNDELKMVTGDRDIFLGWAKVSQSYMNDCFYLFYFSYCVLCFLSRVVMEQLAFGINLWFTLTNS